MLCFSVNRNGAAVTELNLDGAYLLGSEGVPLRAEVAFRDSHVVCQKRADGPAGLALLWPVRDCGAVLLETSRLMERDRPYNLSLELVRGRLTKIHQRREEWGLYDFEGIEPVAAEIDKARDLFVSALKLDSLPEQSQIAEDALKAAFIAGEALSRFHADVLFNRRRAAHAFSKRIIGCTVDLANTSDAYRQRLKEACDFACLPIPWRAVAATPDELNWQPFDAWVEWLAHNRMPIKVGPLVSFHESHLPAWLRKKDVSYEKVRNLVFEHVRRVVDRYSSYVSQWDVISGVHAENVFDFTFEQLMELTRVTVALVKQLAPRAQAVMDLIAPWGEYYARNQRTIPPMLYADMVVQSGVGFDGLGVQFAFGAPMDGLFVRDMFQVSEKLDRLGTFGKPVHITAIQVPSQPVGNGASAGGGCWFKPWDETVQALWVKEFFKTALSKPFVESVTWRDLADRPDQAIPTGGLLNADLRPKLAFKTLQAFRSELHGAGRRPPAARKRA